MKYKNKNGMSLNCNGADEYTELMKEVISEGIRLLESEGQDETGFILAGLQIWKAGDRKAFGKGRLMVSIILDIGS